MRKLIVFLVLFCSLFLISCETSGPVNINGLFSLPVKWTATLKRTTDGESGVFTEQSNGGGYTVLIDYTDSQGRGEGDNGVKLAKLDNTGKHQWTTELSNKEDLYDEKGVFIDRNNYTKSESYLVGINKLEQYGLSNMKLSYVSNGGQLVWERIYNGSNDDVLYGSLVLNQHTSLVYGKTNSHDGDFERKTGATGYDGFIFVISNKNGEIIERHFYDYGREDNAVKDVLFRSGADLPYMIVGETNNGSSTKIWLKKMHSLYATAAYDTILKGEDNDNYFFGGIVETGLNSYILACEKTSGNERFLGFYSFYTAIEKEELIIDYAFEINRFDLSPTTDEEKIIGVSPFSDGSSILIGTKHGFPNDYTNTFLLLNQETGAIKTQDYRYKKGVVYEYLGGNPYVNSYGLTGSDFLNPQESDFKRVAGGADCWVESL